MKNIYRQLFAIAFAVPGITSAQSFDAFIDRQDQFHMHTPREKIYVHTDKPSYFTGDTIWLKGYILSSVSKAVFDSSKLAYVELIDTKGEVVKRLMPACNLGLFSGHIILKSTLEQGPYLLRAYTRRLEGWGDSLFFKKTINIIDPRAAAWQTQVQQLQFQQNRLLLATHIFASGNRPMANQPVNITISDGRKQLWQARLSTNDSGLLRIDTLLEAAIGTSANLRIRHGKDLDVQLPVHNPSAIADLQFLPEGGSFVYGKKQRLGFKALNYQGKGVEVSGVIQNSKGEKVAGFASLHKGMGFVALTPVTGDTYTAVLPDGSRHALPAATTSGTVLRVDNTKSDSIRIFVDATPDLYQQPLHFSVTENGISIASGTIRLNGKPFALSLAKSQFVSGVVVTTLYDKQLNPVNERAAFIWLNDGLHISVQAHKAAYQARDSVHLQVQVKNAKQQGVPGSFSIAVIDTSQVKTDPYAETMLSRILLGSDLQGRVEDPAWYFSHPNAEATEALMLTQGWVSYRQHAQLKLPPYEKEYSITGKVVSGGGKPLKNTRVNLYGKNGMYDIFFADTTTNNDGRFTFSRFPVFSADSADIILKALNKNDRSFSVGIQMLHEPVFPKPPMDAAGVHPQTPLVLDLNARQTYLQRSKLLRSFRNDGSFMEEVVVKAKTKVPGSYNLNPDGGADQTIYKEELDKSAKIPLLDFMLKNVKGLNIGLMKAVIEPERTDFSASIYDQKPAAGSQKNNDTDLYLKLYGNLAKFIIDGVDLDLFYTAGDQSNPNDYLEFLKVVLNNFSAEDITGIEVLDKIRYASKYQNTYYNSNAPNVSIRAKYLLSYVEITTRGGAGPVMQSTPGVYHLKPLYPTVSKQFYSPRYNAGSTILSDTRATLYWNSNMVTDQEGRAGLHFYTSDNPGAYLIIIEGTDLKGGIGSYRGAL